MVTCGGYVGQVLTIITFPYIIKSMMHLKKKLDHYSYDLLLSIDWSLLMNVYFQCAVISVLNAFHPIVFVVHYNNGVNNNCWTCY